MVGGGNDTVDALGEAVNSTAVMEAWTKSALFTVTTSSLEENSYLYSTEPWVSSIISGVIAEIVVKFSGRKVLKCK